MDLGKKLGTEFEGKLEFWAVCFNDWFFGLFVSSDLSVSERWRRRFLGVLHG